MGTAPRGGGIRRCQRAGSLFLLPIHQSNHLRWFMSHHNILWWRNPHRHPRNGTLLVLSPLLDPSARQGAYIERVSVIPFLIPPSRARGSRGRGHSSRREVPAPVAARRTPPFCQAGGRSGPSVAKKAAHGSGGGSSPPHGVGEPSFRHSRGPAQTRGEADWKHTCDCPGYAVHYETCIQSLLAQVQDLRTQNLELQWSQQ